MTNVLIEAKIGSERMALIEDAKAYLARNHRPKIKKCCLCGYDIPEAIEEHHITHGEWPVTIMLCANCHRIVTRLDRCQGFYDYERCRDLILHYREIRDIIWEYWPRTQKDYHKLGLMIPDTPSDDP